MEEIFLEMANEILKSGILGAIILWLLIERYLRDTRSDKVNKDLNESIKELIIKLEGAFKL